MSNMRRATEAIINDRELSDNAIANQVGCPRRVVQKARRFLGDDYYPIRRRDANGNLHNLTLTKDGFVDSRELYRNPPSSLPSTESNRHLPSTEDPIQSAADALAKAIVQFARAVKV